ncbi:MAG: protein kinase [Verrucomicrobia bacterium]|nr:protein kinase [Verrucomicrobiota bacterium]
MKTIRMCHSCGVPLPPDAPAGLCPACLLKSEAPLSAGAASENAPAIPPPLRPMPGEAFGAYRILRLLGQGGMGEVYEAEQLDTGRRVALKVMNHALTSEQDRKRFLREGRLAAGVSHPNVVYIYGSEEISGCPVIAMELVSSGTLKDRIKRGPLPPHEAVDVALQLIAGLEAAQSTGVLHRDIKPGNCFVGADGTIKVGDFGLSISTIARGESLLTASGSVVGTPAYASPEQLRGEDLDVASDLYSVGATLYHLLTGRPPHETTDFVKLITEVLDKTPPSPDTLRPEIAAGLAKVVMRCLAKERKARFASYAALRDALLPFSSTAPSPAVLGLRFVAGLVDEVAPYVPSLLLLVWIGRDATEKFLFERTPASLMIAVGFLVLDLLYYAVPEGLWGASIGKALCGLRVVGPNRGVAGLPRALLRTLIFRITWSIPILATVLLYTSAEYQARANAAHLNPEDWFWFPLLALLFCTMRRRNGFAGLHELASRTRVIVRPTAQARPKLAVAPALATAPSSPTKLGPYEILGSLGTTDAGELLLAHDPALRRNLWVHRTAPDAPPVSARRRDLSRATRLRWLNGHRDAASAWDAYEAPDGAPLLKLPPQHWAAVRFWLHDLAAEYAAGSKHESLPPALELDRVWITTEHRALVLDFPFPGVAAGILPAVEPGLPARRSVPRNLKDGEELLGLNRAAGSTPSTAGRMPAATLNGCATSSFAPASDAEGFSAAQKFLHAVADYALRRENRTATPPPLHAQPFLRSLADGRFEAAEVLVGNLLSLLTKPAEVSRRRRLATICLAAGPVLLVALAAFGAFWFTNQRTERAWPHQFAGSAELRAELRGYETFAEWPAVKTKGTAAGQGSEDPVKLLRRAFKIHFAGHHRAVIADTNFWAHPAVAEALGADLRRVAEEALTDYPTVTAKQLEEADAGLRLLRHAIQGADQTVPQWVALVGGWLMVIIAALLDFGCVLVLGEGLFLRLLGVATVTRNGHRASRFRLLGRTLLAWSPCAVGVALTVAVWLTWLPGFNTGAPALVWVLGFVTVLALAGVAWAVWKPARSLPDLAVRTWLVPR